MTAPKIPQPTESYAPDWEDVRQVEPVMRSVPVQIDGIVSTWSLPAKRSANHNFGVNTLAVIPAPVELIPADPRIKRAWISSSAAGVTVGTQQQVMNQNGANGFVLPIGLPMPWEGFEQALYGVGTGAAIVSVRYEYWAD